MEKYACKNTKTEDLWNILSEESGLQVSTMMDTWTKKKGYPVISVKHKQTNLEFEQVFLTRCFPFQFWCIVDWADRSLPCYILIKASSVFFLNLQSQFLYSGLQVEGHWIVPLTLSLGSGMKRKNFLLESKLGKLDISSLYDSPDFNSCSSGKKNLEEFDENFWVKLNVGQTGFYRVKYDEKLAAKLRKAIEEKCLCATDRFGLSLLIIVN